MHRSAYLSLDIAVVNSNSNNSSDKPCHAGPDQICAGLVRLWDRAYACAYLEMRRMNG